MAAATSVSGGALVMLGSSASRALTRSCSIRKNTAPPSASASSTASWIGVMVISDGSGNSSGADSAEASTSHPSPPGSPPAPVHSTSPAVVSSSSMVGE